jgi:hypothetical protein
MGGGISSSQSTASSSSPTHKKGMENTNRTYDSSSKKIYLPTKVGECLVRPSFYTSMLITTDQLQLCQLIWKSIVNNRSGHFLKLKKENSEQNVDFPFAICQDYFSHLFFQRLFHIHPCCKKLFHCSHQSHSKMRAHFISFLSITIESGGNSSSAMFIKLANSLAKAHHRIGVRANECKLPSIIVPFHFIICYWLLDGMGCETILFAIQQCIGPEVYTHEAHLGFIRIFSRFLDAVLPAAIMFESIKQAKEQDHPGDVPTSEVCLSPVESTGPV